MSPALVLFLTTVTTFMLPLACFIRVANLVLTLPLCLALVVCGAQLLLITGHPRLLQILGIRARVLHLG